MRRRVTDLQLARRCWDVGLAGFALKSHYVPTAERAAVLNDALNGAVQVLGTLTLNAAVGGMNPLAVEIAAREGARIVWMPTLDAANHRDKSPTCRRVRPRRCGWRCSASWTSRASRCSRCRCWTPPAGRCPRRWKCSGWPPGTSWSWPPAICPPGRRASSPRRRSRPGYGTSSSPTRSSRSRTWAWPTRWRWPGRGRSWNAASPPRSPESTTGPGWWANIRATGPEQTIVTTDLGQPANPPVEDGLALMADALQTVRIHRRGDHHHDRRQQQAAGRAPEAQDGTR